MIVPGSMADWVQAAFVMGSFAVATFGLSRALTDEVPDQAVAVTVTRDDSGVYVSYPTSGLKPNVRIAHR